MTTATADEGRVRFFAFQTVRIFRTGNSRSLNLPLPSCGYLLREEANMEKTIQTLAAEMSGSFEGATRSNGEEFRKLREDAPEWMSNVCREAHDKAQMLPDDWRYHFIEQAVDAIADHGITDSDDALRSIEPDLYTGELTGWLSSRNSRVHFLDEALSHCGPFKDGFNLLATAQMMEKEEVFQQVVSALENVLERQMEETADAVANPRMRSPGEIAADGRGGFGQDNGTSPVLPEHGQVSRRSPSDIAADRGGHPLPFLSHDNDNDQGR